MFQTTNQQCVFFFFSRENICLLHVANLRYIAHRKRLLLGSDLSSLRCENKYI